MPEVQKLLCKNYSKGAQNKRFLILHYVGAVSSARNNAEYFAKNTLDRSCHFFVDDHEIWQSVPTNSTAWHVGASRYLHPYARNENSIGIEMCCYLDKEGTLQISEKTIKNTLYLAAEIVKKYRIGESNILRHFDVTGKLCPAPWVLKPKEWDLFKWRLKNMAYLEDWQKQIGENALDKLHDKGLILEPEAWKEKLGENVPNWLFFEMLHRMLELKK